MENTFITLENTTGQKKEFKNLIGVGKTRNVFDSCSVFKEAKNDSSILNNMIEVYLSRLFPNGCFAKVISYTKDFKIIECEKAVCKMKNKDECRKIYNAIYGHFYCGESLEKMIKRLDNRNDYYRVYDCYKQIKEMNALKKDDDFKSLLGEVISEWNTGYIDNKFVIVDYGLEIFYNESFIEKIKGALS